jgi:hypothetical protein
MNVWMKHAHKQLKFIEDPKCYISKREACGVEVGAMNTN